MNLQTHKLPRRLSKLKLRCFSVRLASLNRRSENVIVKPIIVPELELRNVKMQVFLADIVEGTDDAALDDAPEALNRVGVDGTYNILALSMVNGSVRIGFAETMIANPLIRAEQANLVRHGFIDEGLQRRRADVSDDAGDDVTLAANCASDDGFARTSRAGDAIALVGVTVLSATSNESFVNFDNAAQLSFGFDQSGADFVSHEPSGFDRTKTHVAAKLACAHSLFTGQDQMRDFVPVAKRLVGVFENGPGQVGEPIAVRGALFALPMMTGSEGIALAIATTRANDTIGPAPRDQIGDAGIFIANREHGVKLGRSELVDGSGALGFGHGVSSFVGGYCHG